jgi:3-phenylpropionate/trans-cinnamate dioxygenase ferredoxin reductase subunit
VTVAVVGAGVAGVRVCEELRAHGYADRLVLIGAEAHAPYARPPLSKEVLRGQAEPAAAALRSPAELDALGIELLLGRAATRLRVAARELDLDDGTTLGYRDAVLATGALARPLPGAPAGVLTLRTVDDCLALRTAMQPGARVAIVGAGFIGLEVAAAARSRGCRVTVVDPLPTPMARALPAPLGATLAGLHRDHEVELRLGVGVESVRETDGPGAQRSAFELRLSDRARLTADVVVSGIGAEPATRWLSDAGLRLDDGVVCDAALRAAPHLWAVGDLARWPAPGWPATVRVEHWTNAVEQPAHVARAICGDPQPYAPVPYFWSDQYDAKLQCLGYDSVGEEVRVVRGELAGAKWVALVRSGSRLGAVIGLRSPGAVMRLRPLLQANTSWEEALASAG